MPTPPPPRKETKAQRNERVKREKAPWDILPDLFRYAREGYEAIDPDDLDVRFRAWGIYTQGDGAGVYGRAVPHFMVRIRIPGGQLTAHQVRTIATLAERHGRGLADVTNRQNVQLHWLRIEDLPAVFLDLWRAGLTTQGACGDDARNITGCPLAGVDADEVCDASPLIAEATRLLNGNPDFGNLPRKFKISITGCSAWCSYPEINDVGLTAVRRRGELGFALQVGGGLSTAPHLAERLPVFVGWDQVLPVVRGIAELFRDSDCLREHRSRARLKFLFLHYGWDAERFLDDLERRLGFRLAPALPEPAPAPVHRDHAGIHRQRQRGLYYAGFPLVVGRTDPAQLRTLADLADEFGDGRLRTTGNQNIVVLGVRRSRLADLERSAAAAGLPLRAGVFQRGTLACTGSQFCKLAITETKGFSAEMVAELERRLPGFPAPLRLHVTGCPNSCGQHWIADVGLQGVRLDGGDGYEVFLGGGLGQGAGFVRRTGARLPAAQVPDALERLLRAYLDERRPEESFRDFARRAPDEALAAWLQPRAGAEQPA